MAELRLLEDRTYERADARWFRLGCPDPECAVLVEARIEPAASADPFIAVCRAAHEQLHAERAATQTEGSGT